MFAVALEVLGRFLGETVDLIDQPIVQFDQTFVEFFPLRFDINLRQSRVDRYGFRRFRFAVRL